MNAFVWAGSILAILTYIPLWMKIRSGVAKQNIYSWGLWSALDVIIVGSIFLQGGTYYLAMTYMLGGSIAVYLIWRAGDIGAWTRFESTVAFLVAACMTVWYLSGNAVATVASTLAMQIAGIPQLVDAWRKPKDTPVSIYCCYFVANCLSIAGAKAWTIEERFYPTMCAIGCSFYIIVPLLRRRSADAIALESAKKK